MKQKLSLLLILAMSLSITACGGQSAGTTSESEPAQTSVADSGSAEVDGQETTAAESAKDSSSSESAEQESVIAESAAATSEESEAAEEEPEEEELLTPEEYAEIDPEALIDLYISDRTQITPEEYVALITSYKYAEVNETSLFIPNCPTDDALSALRNDENAVVPELDTYINLLLGSDERAARYYGVGRLGSWLGILDADIEPAKELLKTEEDPLVLRKAVDTLASYVDSDADVAEFMIRMAEHEHPEIRTRVLVAISHHNEVDGVFDAVMKLTEDEDDDVRDVALEYCGKLQDERVIPVLEAVLNDMDQVDFHGAAAEGLAFMWHGPYASYPNTNEAAYLAALNYITNCEITDKTPFWLAVRTFYFQDRDGFEDWKTRAEYFNAADVIAAMTRIISAPDADYLAVVGAVESIQSIGTRADLEANKALVDALEGSKYDHLKEEYAAAIEEAP